MSFSFNPSELGFKKTNQVSTNAGGFKPQPITRLIKILEVSPAMDGSGYFIGIDLKNEKQLQVQISAETVQRGFSTAARQKESGMANKAKASQGFSGWLIDEDFKKVLEGQVVIASRTVPQPRKKELINGVETTFIEAQDWIIWIKEYHPNKVFHGLWTAYARMPQSDKYVNSFQLWDPKGGFALDFSDNMVQRLEEEGNRLDEIARKYDNIRALKEADPNAKPEYPLRRGFQVRAFKVESRLNEQGETVYTNVLQNRFMPLLSSFEQVDEQGNVISRSRELTKDKFEQFLDEYMMLAFEQLTDLDPSEYNLADEDKPIVPPRDVLIEVWMFDEYPASNLSESLAINSDKPNYTKNGERIYNVFERMTRKLTKPQLDSEPNDFYVGRGLAIDGIVRLSNDAKIESKRIVDGEEVTVSKPSSRNIVNRLHTSGYLRDLMYRLPATNGGRVVIPDELLTEEELVARSRYRQGEVSKETPEENDPFGDGDFV